MLRLFIVGLLIYLIWSFWKKATGAARRTAASSAPGVPKTGMPAEMVACARCGTFILKAESIDHDGQAFCSEACRRT
jgi:hypothetical protein